MPSSIYGDCVSGSERYFTWQGTAACIYVCNMWSSKKYHPYLYPFMHRKLRNPNIPVGTNSEQTKLLHRIEFDESLWDITSGTWWFFVFYSPGFFEVTRRMEAWQILKLVIECQPPHNSASTNTETRNRASGNVERFSLLRVYKCAWVYTQCTHTKWERDAK